MNYLLIIYVTIVTPSSLSFYRPIDDGNAIIETITDVTNIEKWRLRNGDEIEIGDTADTAIKKQSFKGISNGGGVRNLQNTSFLHYHGAGKSNRRQKETSKKASFDQLTWLLQQHKSIKDRLSKSHGNKHEKMYNKYFKKYFRSFREVVNE